VAVAAGFFGCAKKEKPEEPARPIKSMAAGASEAFRTRQFSGIAKSLTESELSFRVSGTIETVGVKTGDAARKDQVLAGLDPTDYETKLDEAKARYVQAQGELGRYRRLYEEENATKQELDKAQADFDASKSQFELAQKNLAYTVLKAPADGLIAEVKSEVHETVRAGQTVCVFESGGRLEIEVGLPESLIGKIVEGQTADVAFDSIPGKSFSARATEIGVKVRQKTGTFPVVVELLGKDERLRSGMVADVEFKIREAEAAAGVFIIPAQAVLEDASGMRFVWVYDQKTSRVNKRPVKAGWLKGEGIEILEGLKRGEIIATAGVHYLKEGQKVKLLEE